VCNVVVERPVIRYITTGTLYMGIYRAEIITTQPAESNVSQLLQQVGLRLGFRGYGNTTNYDAKKITIPAANFMSTN